ncbi:hypothetical protein ACWCOP_05175 [Maricaulaceae bacterium MS644]
MTRFLLAAACGAAFVLPGLSPAEAQSYGAQSRYGNQGPSYEQCIAQQRNRQIAGAVIGGVIGAVLGAEIHDGGQDRARNERGYRGHRGYRGRDHGYRGHRGRGYQEEGNDGAVLAGAGLGAVAGAAVGGAGSGCDAYARRSGGGYGAAPGHYGSDVGYRGDAYGYADPRYDDRRYDSRRYDTGGYDQYGYDDRRVDDGYGYDDGYGRSSGELLGGPDYRPSDSGSYGQAQVYTAGSSQGSASAPANGACRDMQSSGRLVYMCQGTDGIWRPAQTYR